MPHKIGFRVNYVSGEDDKFRAKELNSHGPTVRGWQSPKFCIYPQELIIQLDSPTKMCKIQILSHQSLIATMIEIHVGTVAENTIIIPQNAKFQKLGFITLSDNERTNYKARELKSILVDALGVFVKFVIHKNHVNRHNLCNQVGIVAINVIGDEIRRPSSSAKATVNGEDSSSSSDSLFQRRPDYISPLDDLAFDMYQDPEVALIIRKLEAKKQQAVLDEQYAYAKKLKQAMLDLQKAGEKLGKYEIEKRQATDMEDYEKARQKQQQMEDFRLRIYAQLELPELLDMKNVKKQAEILLPPSTSSPILPTRSGLNGVDDRNSSPSLSDEKPNSYEAYENRTVPALRKRDRLAEEELPEDDSSSGTKVYKGIMSEKDLREAKLPIEVFGMKLVENAFSKTFSERHDALKSVHRQLKEFNPAKGQVSATKMFRSATFLVSRALRDKVLTVFTQGLTVLTTLLTKFPDSQRINRNELSTCVEKVVSELLIRTGDSALRIRSASMEYILSMADYPDIKPLQLVPTICCRPLTSNVMARLAQSKAEIVEHLVKKHGVDRNSEVTVEMVMEFCAPALEHPVGPVRETAERVVIDLYWQRGRMIRRFLLPDNEKARRNMIYRQLFEELDKIDQQQSMPKNETRNSKRASSRYSDTKKNRSDVKHLPRTEMLPVERSFDDGIISLDHLEKICIFCGEHNEAFTDDGLDLHYWRSCPMLIRCKYCKQVVEIASLTEHILTECLSKDNFERCERCFEAVPHKKFDHHLQMKACNAAKPEKVANHCPLCHQNFSPGEEGWKQHLMGEERCLGNPRGVKYAETQREKQRADRVNSASDRATLPRSSSDRSQSSRLSRSSSQKLTASTTLKHR